MRGERIDRPFQSEPAKVVDYGFSVSKEKKTPFIWIEFVFDNFKGELHDEVTARADLYLTDASIDYTLEKLANLGWTGSDIMELDTVSGTFSLVGRKALITGDIEEYEGKKYPKVNFINDPNAPARIPLMDGGELSVLGGKFRGKIAAYRAKCKQTEQDRGAVYDEKTGKKLF